MFGARRGSKIQVRKAPFARIVPLLRFGQPEKTKLYDKILEVLESKARKELLSASSTSGQDRICEEGQGEGHKPCMPLCGCSPSSYTTI